MKLPWTHATIAPKMNITNINMNMNNIEDEPNNDERTGITELRALQ